MDCFAFLLRGGDVEQPRLADAYVCSLTAARRGIICWDGVIFLRLAVIHSPNPQNKRKTARNAYRFLLLRGGDLNHLIALGSRIVAVRRNHRLLLQLLALCRQPLRKRLSIVFA